MRLAARGARSDRDTDAPKKFDRLEQFLREVDVAWRGPNVKELQDALVGADVDEDEHESSAEEWPPAEGDEELHLWPEAVPSELEAKLWRGEPLEAGDMEKLGLGTKNLSTRPMRLEAGAWRVVHLGTSSAIPTRKRNVSSTGILISQGADREPLLMIQDAGEGTVSRLQSVSWCRDEGFRYVRYIFITHIHGDHMYGLPSLLRAIGHYHRLAWFDAERNAGAEYEPPLVQIFAPYGVRSFLRLALHMVASMYVRFSVRELVPRGDDFMHLGRRDVWRPGSNDLFSEEEQAHGLNFRTWSPRREGVPAPHENEVRMPDIFADENGQWQLVKEGNVRVVAFPLKHRVPCFGYAYIDDGTLADPTRPAVVQTSQRSSEEVEIDKQKAQDLGVRGRQYAVLRSGRSVVVKSTGREVRPEDVMLTGEEEHQTRRPRKVVVLGDTCDSSSGLEVVRGADVLVHEATFSASLVERARVAMHSTAAMAGSFAREAAVKRLVLTHFSSRYEGFNFGPERDAAASDDQAAVSHAEDEDEEEEEIGEEEEDFASIDELVAEAQATFGSLAVSAAHDYLEYDVLPHSPTISNLDKEV